MRPGISAAVVGLLSVGIPTRHVIGIGDSRTALNGPEHTVNRTWLTLVFARLKISRASSLTTLAVTGSYGMQDISGVSAPPKRVLVGWYGANGYDGLATSPVDCGGVPRTGAQVIAQVQADAATGVSLGIPYRNQVWCTDNFGIYIGSDLLRAQVEIGNAGILALKASLGIQVIDMAVFDTTNATNWPDGTHPSDAGNDLLADFGLEFVNAACHA